MEGHLFKLQERIERPVVRESQFASFRGKLPLGGTFPVGNQIQWV